jgi:hypothetical protein
MILFITTEPHPRRADERAAERAAGAVCVQVLAVVTIIRHVASTTNTSIYALRWLKCHLRDD